MKNVPERKVKGLPSRGQRGGPLTDAQARAARSRIKRWRLVDRAVGVTHADAACAFESLLAVEPMTPAQMHEGGIGPYARRRVATAQTGGDGETREFETQTGGGENGAGENARPVAAQCPDDLSARREDLEARSALEASGRGGGRSAAAVRREAAARKAAQWARATGHLAHSREKRLAGFLARAGADAEALLRERRPFFFGAGKTGGGARSAPDLMRTGASAALKPHAVEGAPGSLTAAYVALEEQEVTRGRRVAAAAFAPEDEAKGKRGGAARSSLLVAYAPRDARARVPGRVRHQQRRTRGAASFTFRFILRRERRRRDAPPAGHLLFLQRDVRRGQAPRRPLHGVRLQRGGRPRAHQVRRRARSAACFSRAEKKRAPLAKQRLRVGARAREKACEAFLPRVRQVTGGARPLGRLPRRRLAAHGRRASAAAATRRLQRAARLEVLAARREVVGALRGDGTRVFAGAVFAAAGLRLELARLAVPAGLRGGDPAPGVRPDAALVHLRGGHGLHRQKRLERARRVRVRHADGAVDEPPALDARARGARLRVRQRPPPLASRGQALDLALGHVFHLREDEPRGRDGRRIRRRRVTRRRATVDQTRGAFVLLPRRPGDVRLERVRGAREGGRDARFRRRRRFRIVLLEVIVAVIVLFLLLFLVEIVLVLLNGGDARSAEGRRCPPF